MIDPPPAQPEPPADNGAIGDARAVVAGPVVVSPLAVPPAPAAPSTPQLPAPATSHSLIALFPWHLHVPILLVAAIVALAFGLTLPVMKVEKAYFWQDDYTLVTGAKGLWEKGEHFLAAVLLLFSGVFPVIKVLLLGVLLVVPVRARPRARIIEFTDAVGRWSMLDVFVVAMFIVLARSKFIATAEPAPGLYVFCAAVVLSMLLSMELRRLSRKAL